MISMVIPREKMEEKDIMDMAIQESCTTEQMAAGYHQQRRSLWYACNQLRPELLPHQP